jgi:glucose-6-phosphate 1-epimerase
MGCMQSALVRTALPPSVRLETGEGNLPRLRISNRQGQAEIYLHGAHVTAWQPSGHAPVIWVSRDSAWEAGKPIRGGVPICFPWFAAHATEKSAPGHGYARLADWTLTGAHDEQAGPTTLVFQLTQGTTPWPLWPHAFAATYRVTVGSTLGMALEIHNRGTDAFSFEEALHTYFGVQYVREISITGLEGVDFLDKVDGMARKTQGNDPIRFTAETDRIYLNTQAACTIHDPGRRRRVIVRKTGSDTTVVWNPWTDKAKAMADFGDLEWPEMVCVETCNVNAHAVKLAAGGRHTMTASIEVAAS